jgi:hypothetical protein
MSAIIRIPRKQVQAAHHEQLVGYVSAVFKLHIGIANSQANEIMKLDDRDAGADMYSQAMEMCRKLQEKFGFVR